MQARGNASVGGRRDGGKKRANSKKGEASNMSGHLRVRSASNVHGHQQHLPTPTMERFSDPSRVRHLCQEKIFHALKMHNMPKHLMVTNNSRFQIPNLYHYTRICYRLRQVWYWYHLCRLCPLNPLPVWIRRLSSPRHPRRGVQRSRRMPLYRIELPYGSHNSVYYPQHGQMYRQRSAIGVQYGRVFTVTFSVIAQYPQVTQITARPKSPHCFR
jgi:hypothetical protein